MVDVLGTRLGRYDIRERLGRGGMATVYKAWDANLDRWVAVKVLHDYLADESDFKQRFEREAKLVAALSHPNIVQIYDFDQAEVNGQPVYYMVMAYINGPSLRGVMEKRSVTKQSLSIKEIAKVMESVCGALSYAHKQGMVHRDVTPGNILFNEQGDVVLADFGLARLASGARLTQTGMTTGTPIYMSPEQGMGKPGDARSDLYSLGVILYELLCGRAPYDGDSAFAIIMKHVSDPIPTLHFQNTEANPGLESVIQRAMSKDPENRYATADQMLAAFEMAIATDRTTWLRPGPETVRLPAPTRRLAGRSPLALIGGAVVVLGVIVLLSVLARPALAPDTPRAVTLAVLPTLKRPGNAAMTESSVPITDDFTAKTHAAWLLESADPRLDRSITEGVLRIVNKLPATAVTTVINPRSANYGRPIVIETELTISGSSQGPSAAGIIFRYESDDEYYVFAIDGMARVSIWLRKAGEWTELRKLPNRVEWTMADGVNPAGQKNRLKIIVNDNKLQGFVNDKPVIDLTSDPAIDGGGVGIYTATTTNPKETDPLASVDVTKFSVQMYDPGTTK